MDAEITRGISVVPTSYWHRLEDGRVQCDLCPRYCKLREGQRGLCFRTRLPEEERIVLTTYGHPIEKKPLNHFLPGTPILSFGTAGCNLACKFCQNWDISKSREVDTLADSASPRPSPAPPRSWAAQRRLHLQRPGDLPRVRDRRRPACHERGIHDRGGHGRRDLPEPRARVLPPHGRRQRRSQGLHRALLQGLCGGHLEPRARHPDYLAKHETDVWFELTTLLIPGENDSDAEIDEMTRWVVENLGPDVPMHFTAFHPRVSVREPLVRPRGRGVSLREPWSRGVSAHVIRGTVPRHCGRAHVIPGEGLRPV